MAKIRTIITLKTKSIKRAHALLAKTAGEIVPKKTRKRKKSSAKQKDNNLTFKEATQYAKRQMANPETKAEYARGITEKNNAAFRVALRDYLNAPIVHYIKAPDYTGAIGNVISIKATDDFKVIAVRVTITDAAGKELESGIAIQNPRKKHMWKYATTVANANVAGTKISVVALDKPQNRGKGEMVIDRC